MKILAKEFLRGNIRLSISLWRILTAHDFEMGNLGLLAGIIIYGI